MDGYVPTHVTTHMVKVDWPYPKGILLVHSCPSLQQSVGALEEVLDSRGKVQGRSPGGEGAAITITANLILVWLTTPDFSLPLGA